MFEYQGFALVPIVIGVAELLKRAGLNTKVIPIVNLISGIGLGMLLHKEDFFLGLISGITIALISMGLYTGGKNTLEIFK